MIWAVAGYGRYKLNGDKTSAFLNCCSRAGIELRNIHMQNGVVVLEIKNSNFEKCSSIAAEHGTELTRCGIYGFVPFLTTHRKRRMFVLAFIIFLAVFCLNLCFVSRITVRGNETLTYGQVLEVLSQSGVGYGTPVFGIDQLKVQREMVKNCDRLSWVWIEINGTHAVVDIKERTNLPEFFDVNYACNVIASRDGVIKKAVSSGGKLYVHEGDYVRKGDLLIGGVYDSSEYAPVRFIHANGEILAQTFYTLEDDFSTSCIKYSLSEKHKNVFGFQIGNFVVEPCADTKSVLLINDTEKKLKIFGEFYLPLGFTKKKYCEIIDNKYETDYSETERLAIQELTTRFNLMISEGTVIENCEKFVSKNPDGTIHVRLTFECTENIGVESPIEFTQE